MFIILGAIIAIISLVECATRGLKKNTIFLVLAFVLTVMLCLRWGQGTDYYAYLKQFEYVNSLSNLLSNTLHHGEDGWYILLVLAKRIGMNFEVFIGLLSLVMMSFSLRAIYQYSPYKILSLLIMYPTFYLTYFYSAIRQGLVLSLFLGIGLNLIFRKEWVKYYFLIFLLTLFHTSAVLLCVIPIVLYYLERNEKIGIILVIAILLAIIFGYSGALNSLANKFGVLNYFKVSISYNAIFLRIILFGFIYKMHRFCSQRKCELEVKLYNIYVIGIVAYIILAFSATLSQRLTMPFKAVEIILIPIQIYIINDIKNEDTFLKPQIKMWYIRIGRLKILLFTVLTILILNVELIKNIDAYIGQGNYYSWVTPFKYPYISIFNKEKIYKYITYFDNF